MNTEAQTILEGLRQAVDIMEGSAPETEYVKHRFDPVQAPETIDVRSIRQRMGLSQAVFASAFGLTLNIPSATGNRASASLILRHAPI